ncbi:MAG TPA: PPOX class F420-dependent oxidoreductase [Actinomycetota bacterium]|jgi:pyridoxamine 5'-phosphate oxidase family protein|nr:PPOX class F420-dependent oxidoreductase [Actinomycetota bacterium]
MPFTTEELEYLRSQPLGRLATVASDGQPDVTVVGFRVETDGTILIGGRDVTRTRKWRNVEAGNDRVAFVVDDLVSVRPWRPRGIRIYGTAEPVETEGQFGPGRYLRITPTISWSWGVTLGEERSGRRRTVHRKERGPGGPSDTPTAGRSPR